MNASRAGSIAGLLTSGMLVLLACAGSAARTADIDAPPLRAMSYNMHAGTGGLERIAEVIRRAQPDVVGLQEVDVHFSARSGFVDQAAALSELTGMHVRFAHIYELPPDSAGAMPREYGVALLSRHPVIDFQNHVIPRLSTVVDEPEPQPRPGFLDATIDFHGTAVRVFNTHLDYRGNPRVRQMQVAAMLPIIDAAVQPTILLGDLNAEPHAPELQPLLSRLRDAWTVRTGSGFTFPATAPVKRIDYVLHSAHFRADSAEVIPTDASDHLPILATFRLLSP